MPAFKRIAIVGACAAGITAAETLREEGFAGEVILIGDEIHPGYDRPPLSKKLLRGDAEFNDIQLRAPADLTCMGIEVRRGLRATRLDLENQIIFLSDGEQLAYDGLIIATGLKPRQLPVPAGVAGVHTLRTLDDALALRSELKQAARVLVVGAGFLGCEIAATARQIGSNALLLDTLALPLLRQLGREFGVAVRELQALHGVEFRGETGVRRLTDENGKVTGAVLSNGDSVLADVVVVAIGSTPATEWLQGSGLNIDNGVLCDRFCRAAQNVYAAGDVANWFHPGYQKQIRLEQRMNATEQGMAAAQNLLGAATPFAPTPYFWTDLYDVKIQGYGRIEADAEMKTLSGEIGQTGFTCAYVQKGKVAAVVGWNAPRELRRARQWLDQPVGVLA
jgi:3-phenylpropionate/trans-cinnamate dioxygenase ferredoxin reductase subunit